MIAIERKLDIIGIAESWLTDEVFNGEINLDGFTTFRRDRYEIREAKAGGVILYIKNDLMPMACEELNKVKFESVWCKIALKRGEIIVGNCYKSPTASIMEINEMFQVLQSVSKQQVVIMGDFNFPNIDWDTYDSDSHGEDFRDLIFDNFLFQHVKQPTRENNVLDLVITSEEEMVEDLAVIDKLGNSDHDAVTWKLICTVTANDSKKCVGSITRPIIVK